MKRGLLIVTIIFLAVSLLRIFLALSVDGFSSDYSYYVLRQVDQITQTGIPILHDDLSYLGRTYYLSPVFFYILSFFSLVFPAVLVGKIVPNLFAASIVFMVYLIGIEITKNKEAALFTAFLSGFIPVFLAETVYAISIYALVMPLFLLLIYCFIKITMHEMGPQSLHRYKLLFVILIVLYAFLHPSVLLFILFCWIYAFLLSLEGFSLTRSEIELIVFSSLFVLWAFFVTMKTFFLEQGFSVIFGGVPYFLRGAFFSEFTFLESIYKLGIIPVLYGLYSLFRFTYGRREKHVYMLVSLIYLMLILLWFKLIPITAGFIFLGSFLMIIMLLHYDWVFHFFNGSGKSMVHTTAMTLIILYYIVTFVSSSGLPAMTYLGLAREQVPTPDERAAFDAMQDLLSPEDVVIASPAYGQTIAYFAERKTIADVFFFGTAASDRFVDLERIYTTHSLSTALSLFDKYGATHVLVSDSTLENYDVDTLSYLNDDCFLPSFSQGDVTLYEIRCRVVELG